MRKLLAIFLLIIFTVQVIPIRMIGKMLGNNQNTEEVQDDDDGETDAFKITKLGGEHILPYQPDFTMCASRFGNRIKTIIHINEALPTVHAADVLSPPPDTHNS